MVDSHLKQRLMDLLGNQQIPVANRKFAISIDYDTTLEISPVSTNPKLGKIEVRKSPSSGDSTSSSIGATQIFQMSRLEQAAEMFMLRLASSDPLQLYSDETHPAFTVKDGVVLSTERLRFHSPTTYLEYMTTPFLNGVVSVEVDGWDGMIAAHADKARQYFDEWRSVDIYEGHGALLYLASHTQLMGSNYPRHNVAYWVMGQYGQFERYIQTLEAKILKERYGIQANSL